ncbi:MAG: septum formation protein Maf [Candidatus Omnitrophica bacterium]|nr:septum formation protein Maf [Candidatus Omnitrophota bacterium]
MKKVILASGSAQRKNLMQVTGIPFEVRPSAAPEADAITTTCDDLVKHNALVKARDIAAGIDSGVVIGADTVVYLGDNRLVLKPKDLQEAKEKLQELMASPQWVYTGVAVIDVETGTEQCEVEKTKVYMDPLTDAEIDRYHQRVPPLDKAGGFDIEGLGSLFIHRIEGCYTNVIGLPMARLRVMLKNAGITLIGLVMMLSVGGCTTEYNVATRKQEYYLHSTDKEVNIGQRVAAQIEKNFDMVEGVEENRRVQEILDKLVAVCDRKDIVYSIRIIDREDINATALPGGFIFLFKGVLDYATSDDQVAGVIAHEIGHITAKHGLKRMQASYGALLLQIAALEANGNVAGGVNLATTSLFMEYSQDHELEADELGIKYMKKAGYDPQEMIGFLETMGEETDKEIRRFSYWRTHPHIPERIANISRLIKGQMDFRDYIRLIDRVHDDY